MLYLAMMDITKKWTGRRQDWSLIHAQMAIYFAERMKERLDGSLMRAQLAPLVRTQFTAMAACSS